MTQRSGLQAISGTACTGVGQTTAVAATATWRLTSEWRFTGCGELMTASRRALSAPLARPPMLPTASNRYFAKAESPGVADLAQAFQLGGSLCRLPALSTEARDFAFGANVSRRALQSFLIGKLSLVRIPSGHRHRGAIS